MGEIGEGPTRFVESNVAILANTTEEELDTAMRLDLGFVRIALADEILGITVQDVHL